MAMIITVDASIATTVLIKVSRFLTCPNSWAKTPEISRSVSSPMIPVVAATAAFWGLRPVAKAFGIGVSTT